MATTDYAVISWRKSSFSNGAGGSCVEVGVAWRKSSYSNGAGGNCVEVGAVWRKSSYSNGAGGDCVEVGPTADAILVRDTKNRDGGTLAVTPSTWRALTATLSAGSISTR